MIEDFIKKDEKSIDPITIGVILQIVVFILQNCVLNNRKVNSPYILEKWALKRIVRKQGGSNKEYEYILNLGKGVTSAKLDDLVKDSKRFKQINGKFERVI